ncbi:MAG: hypothetical protein HY898_18955 [Deltaproteobacteria bacterium]|nr:hypothetical protein [Deltaproteobacteria bacterium]
MSSRDGRVASRGRIVVAALSAAAIPFGLLTLGPIAANAQTAAGSASALTASTTVPAASTPAPVATPPISAPKPLTRGTVLVFGSPQDRVVQRLRSELVGLGLQVIIVDSAAPDASTGPDASLARSMDAVGAVRMLPAGGGVEVWVMEQGTGRTLEHDMVSDAKAPDPDAAIALRAVELLRARLLPTVPKRVHEEEPEPDRARPEREPRPTAPPPPQPVQNLLGLHVVPDFSLYSGTDVCGQESQRSGKYGCFRDDDKQYHGNPTPVAGNEAPSGFRWAGLRVLLSYDRVLGSNIALGARAGLAFGGGPKFDDGGSFRPFHLEARASYWFGDRPFSSTGLMPFIFVAGGMAQFDSKSEVPVRESEQCSTYPGALCPVYAGSDIVQYNPQGQTVTGWHRSGRTFVGGGLGAMYAISVGNGPVASLKVSQAMSPSTTVLSPELGWVIGF